MKGMLLFLLSSFSAFWKLYLWFQELLYCLLCIILLGLLISDISIKRTDISWVRTCLDAVCMCVYVCV